MNKLKVFLLSMLALAVTSTPALAAYDTSSVTDGMSEAVIAIGLIGTAYLGVKIGIRVWPWIASVIGR